jgi:hypothetical protein
VPPIPQKVDPTENVKALAAAGFGRQDDLRELTVRLIDARTALIKETADLKYQHAVDLIKAQQEEIRLRAELGDKLSTKETDRINAIRLVDVQAVQVATERATAAATSLASQVVQSAEVLRTQQARQAEDFRASLATATAEISKRLTTVEQGQSEGRGKQQFQDPAISALVIEVQKLSQQRAATSGTDTGRIDMFGWILAAITALIAVLMYLRRGPLAP